MVYLEVFSLSARSSVSWYRLFGNKLLPVRRQALCLWEQKHREGHCVHAFLMSAQRHLAGWLLLERELLN